MTTWSILKTIWFILLFWLFFAYWISNDIFIKMQANIKTMNQKFFSEIPSELLFLFVFFIFIIIFATILSYYSD
jgi:hypothetical protein